MGWSVSCLLIMAVIFCIIHKLRTVLQAKYLLLNAEAEVGYSTQGSPVITGRYSSGVLRYFVHVYVYGCPLVWKNQNTLWYMSMPN